MLINDGLTPMLETCVVMRDEWTFVLEKAWGQVQQICLLRDSYVLCLDCVKEILFVLIDLRDTMRCATQSVRQSGQSGR